MSDDGPDDDAVERRDDAGMTTKARCKFELARAEMMMRFVCQFGPCVVESGDRWEGPDQWTGALDDRLQATLAACMDGLARFANVEI